MRAETDLALSEAVGVELPYWLELAIQHKILITPRGEEEVDIWMLELESFQPLLEGLSLNTVEPEFPGGNNNYFPAKINRNNITGIHGQTDGP